MMFATLVLIEFFKAYSYRSDRHSIVRRPFANRWLNLAIAWEVVLLVLVVNVPFLQDAFGTTGLSGAEWALAVAAGLTIVPVLEVGEARRESLTIRLAGSEMGKLTDLFQANFAQSRIQNLLEWAGCRWCAHFEPRDLTRVVELWERAGHRGALTVDEAVELLRTDSAVGLVAESNGRLGAVVVATAAGGLGWIHELVLDGDAEAAEALLDELEAQLADAGAARLAAAVHAPAIRSLLEARGYEAADDLVLLARAVPSTVASPEVLAELGALLIPAGAVDGAQGDGRGERDHRTAGDPSARAAGPR